jgi:cytochrome c2
MPIRLCSAVRHHVSRPSYFSLLLILCFVAIYSLGVGLAGVVAGKRGYPHKIKSLATRFVPQRSISDVVFSERTTNLHSLTIARVKIGNGLGSGGGLAELAGHVLFASSKGRLGYLGPHNDLHSINATVPMGLDALRDSPLYKDPLFSFSNFRVAGLLAVQTGPSTFRLFVSHHHYRPGCMGFEVSSILLEADEKGVRVAPTPQHDGVGSVEYTSSSAPVAPNWDEVFIARPNCIRTKDRNWPFGGLQAGGRLAQLDDHTVLLSIGDHQFDGFNDSWAVSMDPTTDLGKIIKIDMRTGASQIYAMGVRNPQGLAVARDGRVWETEHGPQGGDEVNLIREGANYGWPIVTYGMNYGYPRRNWSFAPVPGAHDGYQTPAFAFVPSVGISSIAEPDVSEFPSWRNSLIASSLRANTLFLLRIEGDRIVYAEPISADHDRVRDIISLRDGSLAYLSDEGDIVFIRNAECLMKSRRPAVISGLASLTEPYPEEAPAPQLPPVDRGRQVYFRVCANCHALDGGIRAGPPLNGVTKRRVGSAKGFAYSDALAKYDEPWTRDLLTSFLTEPDRYFHGTAMRDPSVSWTEVPSIISFLETTRLTK